MTLKELRLKNKLTQSELGKRINRKQVTISQYENGCRIPDLNTIVYLASELHVSVDELVNIFNADNQRNPTLPKKEKKYNEPIDEYHQEKLSI